jgi:hypothetical protein
MIIYSLMIIVFVIRMRTAAERVLRRKGRIFFTRRNMLYPSGLMIAAG